MYLYNITIIAENEVRDAVKQCIDAHFSGRPEANLSPALLQMLDSPHEGTTYCIQLRTETGEDIRLFQQQHLSTLQKLLTQRYPGKVLFFDSTMKYLNEQ